MIKATDKLLVIVTLFAYWLAGAQDYNIYYGNIHAHSAYSDGCKDGATTLTLTPAQCYAFAKKSMHMDFLGISEHNHSEAKMKLPNYHKGIAEADSLNRDGSFVCLYGMEYGVITNGGHVLVYGFDKLIGWEDGNYDIYSPKYDYASLFKIIAANKRSFATLAHPEGKQYNNLLQQNYNIEADQAICGAAVSSGPAFSTDTVYADKGKIKYYSYYKKLLSLGYIIGPTMDHDNHYTTFGRMSTTRTAVLATTLSRDSIIGAFRANRFYATEDWNAKVSFTVNSRVMGSYVIGENRLDIRIAVTDPDASDTVKSIKLMYGRPGNGIEAKALKTAASGQLTHTLELTQGDAFYFYAEIQQADGDKIYTSPIWAK